MPAWPASILGCKVTLVPPCKSKPNLNDVAPITKATPVKARTVSSTIEIVRSARDWVFAILFADIWVNSRDRCVY